MFLIQNGFTNLTVLSDSDGGSQAGRRLLLFCSFLPSLRVASSFSLLRIRLLPLSLPPPPRRPRRSAASTLRSRYVLSPNLTAPPDPAAAEGSDRETRGSRAQKAPVSSRFRRRSIPQVLRDAAADG